jgi:hypothetical protein
VVPLPTIANPTPNLRLTVNYAYTDRSVSNLYNSDLIPWYGYKLEDGLILNGITQDASGNFIADPGAYHAGGAANGFNEQKRDQEKRWGLRPHRVSVFAAYDFKRENFLKGFSIGAGYRWRSANIIGTDINGNEIEGRSIRETDFMLRYVRRLKPALWKGNLILQLNVINVFDQRGIIPKYFSANPPYEVPGGRGIAYNRFDIIAPRSVRFTTTYEF